MRLFALMFSFVLLGSLPALAAEEKAAKEVAPPAKEVVADPTAAADLLKVTSEDHILGDAKAPVTIIEYSSLSCPHCAHFHNDILPQLEKDYIDTGKANLVFRPFPLNAPALKAGIVLSCVPKDKYYTFTRVFYRLQEKWAFTENYLADLKTISKVGGMTEEQFDACVNDKKLEEKAIEERKKEGDVLKIEATPTFYINGEKIQGASDYTIFKDAIDKKLKEAEKK
ncbi:MAG: DsbA family protein [Rickettsiales bacterium]